MQVFIGPKIFTALLQQRALHSDEECLRSSIDTFATAYPKVGKGPRNGVGCYAAADNKDISQKCMLLRSGVEFYTAAYQKVWNKVFLFCFETRIWPSDM